MKIALYSDIHANRPAFEAVLKDARAQGIELDSCWVLGDIVGYGPHPAAALMFLKKYVAPEGWVMGNHDAMLADLVHDPVALASPNGYVRVRPNGGEDDEIVVRAQFLTRDDWVKTTRVPIQAIQLNQQSLLSHADANDFWLRAYTPERARPHHQTYEGLEYTLVHASQRDPLSRYIYAWHGEVYLPVECQQLQAQAQASGLPQVQCYGHTHVPTFARAWPLADGNFRIEPERITPGAAFRLDAPIQFINPGSVGQPRDYDQRASYAILDTARREVTFRRVAYDHVLVAHDLQQSGYPDGLVRKMLKASAAERYTPDEWLNHYKKAKLI